MNKTITLEERSAYGNTHYYVTSEHATAIKSLLGGQRTVTESNISALVELGFEVVVQPKQMKIFSANS